MTQLWHYYWIEGPLLTLLTRLAWISSSFLVSQHKVTMSIPQEGNTPLHLAKDLDIIKILLDHHSSIESIGKVNVSCLYGLIIDDNNRGICFYVGRCDAVAYFRK